MTGCTAPVIAPQVQPVPAGAAGSRNAPDTLLSTAWPTEKKYQRHACRIGRAAIKGRILC